MEIPPQSSPKHHGYLPSRRGRRLEIDIARIRNCRYEHVVTVQSRHFVAADIAPSLALAGVGSSVIIIIIQLHFGLEYYGPSGGKRRLMHI